MENFYPFNRQTENFLNYSDDERSTSKASNLTHREDNLYEVPVGIIILLSICYGSISLVAVIGNFCVLWIVATSRRMQTVTNFFIANLACADIIIGLFSIPFQFQAALLQRWVLPNFMCAFCPFVQVLSVNVSIFTLTAIALDRYRAVMSPLKARTSKLRAKLSVLGIWAFSAALGVPNAVALRVSLLDDPATGNKTKPFCQNSGISPLAWRTYNHILVSLQYFVPLFIISYAYIRMGIRLRQNQTPGNAQGQRDANILRNKQKEVGAEITNDNVLRVDHMTLLLIKLFQITVGLIFYIPLKSYATQFGILRVIKMLFIVVAVFTICWLPFQTYNILQEVYPAINEYKYINVIWFCCHWLAMSNSCYNPFVYAIYNERFNTEFRSRFTCCKTSFRRQEKDQNELDYSLSSRYG